MLSIHPVSEEEATDRIKVLYTSIKKSFHLLTVPLIFQYMGRFPDYLEYIWSQIHLNNSDPFFQKLSGEVTYFAQEAMSQIYTPSSAIHMFMEKNFDNPQIRDLEKFIANNINVYGSLYIISLAIRESIKGKYLGLKQIGEKLTEYEDRVFNDLSDGFVSQFVNKDFWAPGKEVSNGISGGNDIQKITRDLSVRSSKSIVASQISIYFDLMEREMKTLLKREHYLTRRVELERFSLAKLHLLPHPLDSSITMIISHSKHENNFPELIYLVAELFPTQSPYKLLASAVMKKSLTRA